MALVSVSIEGGFFPTDLLDRIGVNPDEISGQRRADFGAEGARLSETIQSAFSDAQGLWRIFEHRIARADTRQTSATRDTWMIPLLSLLGHELVYQRAAIQISAGSYRISHTAGETEDAPPVYIVGADRDLDRRADGEKQSPHVLVQEFLNRSDRLWGIVTNGEKLRLLRNSAHLTRPSYVEFDLRAMFEGNLYSEFVLLYRLAHRTRLPQGAEDANDCWLEQYYQQGIDEGGRVREGLRVGVEEALRLLGTGFLSHPNNDHLRKALEEDRLDALGFYRQLLSLIYRLLFLMVAEERKLLLDQEHPNAARQRVYSEHYSLDRLRQLAHARHGDDPHGDLWEGLKLLFDVLRDEDRSNALGLTALNGGLFDIAGCLDLQASTLRNDVLLHALWHLSSFEEKEGRKKTVRRRVNYAGLDVEELGSVYESLLDYHPHVDLKTQAFDLGGGSERKQTGSYYTPHALVSELINSALVPVVEARLQAAEDRDAKEEALLALKICDPAAGSGHFLLAAGRRVGRELAKVRGGEAEPTPREYRRAVRDVVRHCIYAVDANPLAVDLCKVALWIEGHAPGLPLSFLDHRVRLGNSLVGVFDLKVLKEGIPDGAYKPLTGDDKPIATAAKKENAAERKASLFKFSANQTIETLAARFIDLDQEDETSIAGVRRKAEDYEALKQDPDWWRLREACDLWTAAFFAPLTEDDKDAIPTTRDVRDSLSRTAPLQGKLAGRMTELRERSGFFHWPLEFPEVFAQGGFDLMVGNPPWDLLQFSETEFFRPLAPDIADLSGAARKKAIAGLEAKDPELWQQYRSAQHAVEALVNCARESARFPLSTHGKLNLYALFAELFMTGIAANGRAGFIVPTGIATDSSTKQLFDALITGRQLASLYDFENRERVFPGIDSRIKFSLLTVASDVQEPRFCFFATRTDHLRDDRRLFTLSAEDIALINPNTRTCPIFRSREDAELTKRIYRRVPVLIDETKGEEGNAWQVSFRQGLFNMTSDSGHFRTARQLQEIGATRDGTNWRDAQGEIWVPLYEAKMIHQFDHRWATYDENGKSARDVTEEEKAEPGFEPTPRYWVPQREVEERLRGRWDHDWLMGWRDITNATNERTVIAAFFPRSGIGNNLPLLLPSKLKKPKYFPTLIGNMSALVLDFIARHKVGGTHLNFFITEQLAILPPQAFNEADLDFITPRVLALSYTSDAMRSFANEFDYNAAPFSWDADNRALLRGELDAYYAYLYGLTRDELRYILNPADVMGSDYPSETFRGLQANESRRYGEYRTQRLVLEAWDRFCADGTFDPDRLAEPLDDNVRQLAQARREKEALQQALDDAEALLARASQQQKPAVFVEGATDVPIIEAAWKAFYPDEPMPVSVLAAGGTRQMMSLAGKGNALRQVLGDRVVCALADNDSEGRELISDGHVRKGRWKRQSNGIHWCMLAPTHSFIDTMKRLEVPEGFWPFTVEQCFPPALRREAMAEGAYAVAADKVQPDLLREPALAQRLFAALHQLHEESDDYLYLMAPTPEAKDSFADWVTRPERITPENYAAFEPIIEGLRDLIRAQTEDSAA